MCVCSAGLPVACACATGQGGGGEWDVKGAEGLSTSRKCREPWAEAGVSREGLDCQIQPHPKMKFRNLSDSHLELVTFLPSITPLESYFINSFI